MTAIAHDAVREYLWEDLRIGLHQEFTVSITEQMLGHFRDDSGDVNPLHVDAAFARQRGFSDRVVHGMLTASFYSTLVGVYLPGRFALLHGIDISFKHPVFVGQCVRVCGEIRHLSEAYRQVDIRGTMTNDSGVTVSTAKVRVGLLAP
jgi:3-hydroxybutyryl-CoA dehydratase